MKNIVPNTISGVNNSADFIKAGLDRLKVELGMHYADPEQVKSKQAAFVLANGDYEQCKLDYAAHRVLVLSLITEARSLSMIVREMLKPIFGARYGRVWDGTGFKNSLETPRGFVELKELISVMSRHLEQYTEEQSPPLVFMAGSAKDLHERMKAAHLRLASLEGKLYGLLQVRTENMKELRRYLRVVIDELHLVLPPLDPRWELFGLNRPGSKETPDVPENVVMTVIENKRGNITWPRSARAEYYRVWIRVEGVHAEPVAVGSPKDTDFMLEELPQGAVEVFVSAVNGGGESQLAGASIDNRQ